MELSLKSLGNFGAGVAIIVVAYLLLGVFVHAETAPVITTTIRNDSAINTVITSANIGANVRAVAQVASSTGPIPQGSVNFNVYQGLACAGSPSVSENGVSLASGFATSSAYAVGAGGLSFRVHYNHDANNVDGDGSCQPVAATANAVTITTSLSATSIAAGGSVHGSATLNNETANAGGAVTYSIYSDNACQIPFGGAGNKSVTNGVVADSDNVQFNNPGTYYWQAVYHGDANNSPATSTCSLGELTVQTSQTNSPTIVTTLSTTTPIWVNESVNGKATLNGETANAGGTVTYRVFTDNACTNLWANAGSQAVTNGNVPDSSPVLFNLAGTYYWQSVYNGDALNNKATSTCSNALTVQSPPSGKNSPTLATTLSTTSIQTGTSVHDSAVLTGETANAGGTVTYKVYTNNSCTNLFVNAGVKTVTNGTVPDSDNVLFSAAGTYYWQAVYSGDAQNNAASSTCTSEALTVAQSGTTPPPAGAGTISGTVYHDKNNNDVRDSGEEGLAGFTIKLYNSANFNNGAYYPVYKSAVSDAGGNYSFSGLPSGTYSIEQLKKEGWKQGTDDYKSVALSADAGVSGKDFGQMQKNDDNPKDNGKPKKDRDDEDDDSDDDSHSGTKKSWWRSANDNGLHLGWSKGKGNKHRDD
jgi:hypothetical protein